MQHDATDAPAMSQPNLRYVLFFGTAAVGSPESRTLFPLLSPVPLDLRPGKAGGSTADELGRLRRGDNAAWRTDPNEGAPFQQNKMRLDPRWTVAARNHPAAHAMRMEKCPCDAEREFSASASTVATKWRGIGRFSPFRRYGGGRGRARRNNGLTQCIVKEGGRSLQVCR